MGKRFKSNRFVAYFQAHTNTYAPLPELKKMYDEAFEAHPDIMGMAVSTRPDCVDRETLELIASYQQPHNQHYDRYISVEYGLQTIHNQTLEAVNRCETYEEFLTAYEMTRELDLDHCIHVILGMPGETWEMMMQTADKLAELKVNGVKIHMLVAMDKTQIAKQFRLGEWEPMSRETYIQTVCDFLERLHPECVIHRVAGNGHPLHLVAPLWMTEKFDVMADIEAEFARRGTKQGSRCSL